MDEKLKQQLVEQFRAYLDTSPPCDVTSEEDVDLFALFSELAGLRSEVRLESRQFKTALDDFRAAFDAIAVSTEQISSGLRRIESRAGSGANEELRALLLGILDIYDRVSQAASSEKHDAGLFSFMCSGLVRRYQAHIEGMNMLEKRILELLASFGVEHVMSVGMKFDPAVMKAVDFVMSRSHEDGMVCAQQRAGFLWKGKVLRPAEVTVVRNGGDDE